MAYAQGTDVPVSISDGSIIPALSIPADYTQSGAEADHGHCTDIEGTNGSFKEGAFRVTRIQLGQGYLWDRSGGPPYHHHEYWHIGATL